MVNRTLNWSSAGLECRSLHKDAHLLVINDAQEQLTVAEMLASTDRQCLVHVFIHCFASSIQHKCHCYAFRLYIILVYESSCVRVGDMDTMSLLRIVLFCFLSFFHRFFLLSWHSLAAVL